MKPILLCIIAMMIAGCASRSTRMPAPTAPITATSTTTSITRHVPILMYHHIGTYKAHAPGIAKKYWVFSADFANQLAALTRAGYTTVTLDDLQNALQFGSLLPAKPVILTFDDGYSDFYTNAYPLLQQYHDKATIYIISGKVGTSQQMGTFMTWEQLRELAGSPLITVGAHTRSHPALTKISVAQLSREVQGSKADLEQHLSVPVRHFAYPGGRYNARVLRQIAMAGFATAVTTHTGDQQRSDALLRLQRMSVLHGVTSFRLIGALTSAPSP